MDLKGGRAEKWGERWRREEGRRELCKDLFRVPGSSQT